MDYENFKEKIVNDLKDELYERGEDVTIRVNEVKKLNESYEALAVMPEGSNIGVNVDLKNIYGGLENGMTYDEVDRKECGQQ